MSLKNSSGIIRNRTRDLPVCSVLPCFSLISPFNTTFPLMILFTKTIFFPSSLLNESLKQVAFLYYQFLFSKHWGHAKLCQAIFESEGEHHRDFL